MRAKSKPRTARARQPKPARAPFTPVATRARRDGWTPERQIAFLDALAESGCVTEACASVGLSPRAAYTLRARVDAQAFRLAWDAAVDYAIRRLSDVCLSRALHGEPVPHFFKGEQVGEHRRYDNRLAMFLLRYRDPLRYAATLDQMVYTGDVEGAAIRLAKAKDRAADEAWGVTDTEFAPEPETPPYTTVPIAEERARQAEQALVESDAPIYGDSDRRYKLNARRHAFHAAQWDPEARAAQERADHEARLAEWNASIAEDYAAFEKTMREGDVP